MSLSMTRWAFDAVASVELTPGAHIVLLHLANMHNERTGRCFPSIDTLAKRTGLAVRTIQAGIKDLQAKGLLSWEDRPNPRATNRIVRYYSFNVTGANSAPVLNDVTGAENDKSRVQNLHPNQEEITRKKEAPNGASKETRRQRLPKDFSLTQSRVDMGTGFGLDILETKEEFDEFVDYWTGVGRPMLDWDATLRNHFRKAARRRAERKSRQASLGAGRARSGNLIDAALRYAARVTADGVSRPDRGDGGEDPLPF